MGSANHHRHGARHASIVHQHIHHHHYWFHSPTSPPRSIRRHGRLRQQQPVENAGEAAKSTPHVKSYPTQVQFLTEQQTEQHTEKHVPNSNSRQRYIFGTPPGSDEASNREVMSDGFSRTRGGKAEEHTHIHIYVPSKPKQADGVRPQRSPPSLPEPQRADSSRDEQKMQRRGVDTSESTDAEKQRKKGRQSKPGLRRNKHRISKDIQDSEERRAAG